MKNHFDYVGAPILFPMKRTLTYFDNVPLHDPAPVDPATLVENKTQKVLDGNSFVDEGLNLLPGPTFVAPHACCIFYAK